MSTKSKNCFSINFPKTVGWELKKVGTAYAIPTLLSMPSMLVHRTY